MVAANNVLAVYPANLSTGARCRSSLRRNFSSVAALSSGWIVATRRPRKTESEHRPGTELVWEGDARVLEAQLFEGSLEETVRRLPQYDGEAGFARLQPGGRFLVARSCSGLVGTYLLQSPEATWIATSFEDLARSALEMPRGDMLVQALWAEGWCIFPDNRTFVEGIKIVPRGSYALGDGRAVSTTTYWDPRPRLLAVPSETVAQSHAEELHETLMQSLSTLDNAGLNLLTLSGGVDSSALAHLACSLGFRVATFTFVAPHRSTARKMQLSQIEQLIQELGIKQHRRVDAEDAFLDELFRRPLPALYFCSHPVLRLLPELATELGPRVLFTGHFADEVCGHSQRLQDWIRHTSLKNLLNPRYPHPSPRRDIGRWIKRRALESLGRPLLHFPQALDPMFSTAIRHEAFEWCQRERKRLLADPRPLRELATWCLLDGWVAMHWEICSRWGIRPLHPFFSRRMLDLAFHCHPSELLDRGGKTILRRALRGKVPSRYLDRQDKGHWNLSRRYPDRPLTAGLLDVLGPLLSDEYLRPGMLLNWQQHRQLGQIVLFTRLLRENRHAGTRSL